MGIRGEHVPHVWLPQCPVGHSAMASLVLGLLAGLALPRPCLVVLLILCFACSFLHRGQGRATDRVSPHSALWFLFTRP